MKPETTPTEVERKAFLLGLSIAYHECMMEGRHWEALARNATDAAKYEERAHAAFKCGDYIRRSIQMYEQCGIPNRPYSHFVDAADRIANEEKED